MDNAPELSEAGCASGLRPLGLGTVDMVVVVAGGLTEMLQAAPLMRALSGGTCEPLLVVGPPSAAELSPGLCGVHEFVSVHGLGASPGALGLARLWSELRGRRLDTAVICNETAAVRGAVYAAGIPRRIGCAGGLSDRLLTERAQRSLDGNHAGDWLALADPLGIPAGAGGVEFVPTDEATSSAEQLLLSTGVGDGRLLVAIAPGQGFSDVAVAVWGAENFAQPAKVKVSRKGSAKVVGPRPAQAVNFTPMLFPTESCKNPVRVRKKFGQSRCRGEKVNLLETADERSLALGAFLPRAVFPKELDIIDEQIGVGAPQQIFHVRDGQPLKNLSRGRAQKFEQNLQAGTLL